MGLETTYPMAIGQISVFRDMEKLAPERLWEANLPFQWDLSQEASIEEVWAAFGEVSMRHESMRTNYRVEESGELLQFLAADDPATIMSMVDHGAIELAEIPNFKDFEERKTQQVIDIYHGIPWRAWVVTEDGVPKKVVFIVHHIVADGAALLVIRDDFNALLAGEELPPPAGQPRIMALNERGAGAGRLRTAERYWRRTLGASPRVAPDAPPSHEMIGATMYTGIPLELAHEGAAKLNASIQSVVLAAMYSTLREITGRQQILLFPMTANRFDSNTATVVTSLNQWVPLLLEFDGSESFADLASKVHWKAFNSLKNGFCDPDFIVDIREEFEQADPPVDAGFNYNGIFAPPGMFVPVEPEPPKTDFYVPTRATGPDFYLIARSLQRIDLIVRTTRAEFDQPTLATFMTTMNAILLKVAGLPASTG